MPPLSAAAPTRLESPPGGRRPFCAQASRPPALALSLAACLLLSVAAAPRPARAVEPLPAGAIHRGIVAAGPYQIFPENRPGNGVYLDGELLLSLPGQTVLSAAQIAPGGRFMYLVRSNDGKRTLGFRTLPNDVAPRLSEPVKGYQYAVAGFEGQGYKKFFRVTDAAITDLLPASRTADGLTSGEQGILFFHVGTTAGTHPGDAPAGAYGIRLHWLNVGNGVVRHLGRPIYNSVPTLKLAWLDAGRFEYTLSDGTSEILNVTDFK